MKIAAAVVALWLLTELVTYLVFVPRLGWKWPLDRIRALRRPEPMTFYVQKNRFGEAQPGDFDWRTQDGECDCGLCTGETPE